MLNLKIIIVIKKISTPWVQHNPCGMGWIFFNSQWLVGLKKPLNLTYAHHYSHENISTYMLKNSSLQGNPSDELNELEVSAISLKISCFIHYTIGPWNFQGVS